eukprot:4680844-Prymnesium_polylepis.1
MGHDGSKVSSRQCAAVLMNRSLRDCRQLCFRTGRAVSTARCRRRSRELLWLSLIHISEPTRRS